MAVELNEIPPVIDGNAAVFTLATGEKIRVALTETGLGLYGHAIKVLAGQTLLIKPSAGNAIDLYTPRSIAAEEAANRRIVDERTHGVTGKEASASSEDKK